MDKRRSTSCVLLATAACPLQILRQTHLHILTTEHMDTTARSKRLTTRRHPIGRRGTTCLRKCHIPATFLCKVATPLVSVTLIKTEHQSNMSSCYTILQSWLCTCPGLLPIATVPPGRGAASIAIQPYGLQCILHRIQRRRRALEIWEHGLVAPGHVVS